MTPTKTVLKKIAERGVVDCPYVFPMVGAYSRAFLQLSRKPVPYCDNKALTCGSMQDPFWGPVYPARKIAR